MANRYTFATTLEGYINVAEDSGKFNNRCLSFVVPADTLKQMDSDRTDLIAWIKSKDNKRLAEGIPVWDESGLIKYSYGVGDGSRKPKPAPHFVDSNGTPVSLEVLKSVRKGTKCNIIVQQKPYAMGTFNTSVRVVGVQIIELASGNGAVDSGDLSVEDVASMFGTVQGFSQDEPSVRKAEETTGDGESYDF